MEAGRAGALTMKLALSEEMAVTVAVPVPVLVRVRVRAPEADPTDSLPKLRDVGPIER